MPAILTAQQVALFKDIRPGELDRHTDSSPRQVIAAGGLIYFTAEDGSHGRELWRTDLTAEGTFMVRDLAPGTWTGARTVGLETMATAGDALLFANSDDLYHSPPPYNQGLWITRGTAATTEFLSDRFVTAVMPFANGGLCLADVQSNFSVYALLYSDGTPEGTVELHPQLVAESLVFPTGGDAFFFGREEDGGEVSLWKTDGTPDGTARISDPLPAFPRNLTAVGDRVVFTMDSEVWGSGGMGDLVLLRSQPRFTLGSVLGAGDTVYFLDHQIGSVLWATDGTLAGTRRLGGVCVETDCELTPLTTAVVGDRLFFLGQDGIHGTELWVSDGTEEGTGMVRDVRPGNPTPARPPSRLTPVGETLFFVADDGETGEELWKSDGTEEGTVRVADILEGEFGSDPRFLTAGPGVLYFSLGSLWKSDGSAAGTMRVNEERLSINELFGVFGDTLVFSSDHELWASDGTADGTRIVKNIGGDRPTSSSPEGFAVFQDRLVFEVEDEGIGSFSGGQLWGSDGTPEGTAAILAEELLVQRLTPAGDKLFFTSDGDYGQHRLWATDGTQPGTRQVAFGDAVTQLVAAGDTAFFSYFDSNFPSPFLADLHLSDGTPEGTGLLPGTMTGEEFESLEDLASLGDLALFLARTETSSPFYAGLWRSDGTAAGTFRVQEPAALLSPEPQVLSGELLFSAERCDLWASDGASGSARRVRRFGAPAEPCQRSIQSLVAADDRAYFLLTDNFETEFELWSSDGTGAGTRFVTALPSVPVRDWRRVFFYEESHSRLRNEPLFAAGDHVFFVLDQPETGAELWVSDGTAAGTRLLKDVCPGLCGSTPRFPAAAGGLLYFAVDDGTSGWEPWVSDGTAAGTFRLADVAPGSASSSPRHFFPFGDAVFFSADDSVHGAELWAVTPYECPAGAACLGGGRFEVTLRWRNQHAGGEGVGAPIPFSDDSAFFWFFDSDNVELAVKLLDGRPLNDHFWFFYGALSDVEYWIDVEDRRTGETRTYHNPPGELCGSSDVMAFFEDLEGAGVTADAGLGRRPAAEPAAGKGGSCVAGPHTLCLQDGRIAVEVEWRNQHAGGTEGRGRALPATDESGYFWFFDAQNVELIVKALDGRPLNDHFWFFYGALSDVEYWITVTDTVTGAEATYHNPPGELCGRGDINAL